MGYKINESIEPQVVMAGHFYHLNEPHITRTLDNYEMFLVTKGDLYIKQDKRYHLKEGDFFISKANEEYGGYKKSNASFYFIHIEDNGFLTYQNEEEEDNRGIPLFFHLDDFSSIAVQFCEILNYYRKPDCHKVVASLIRSLMEMIRYSLSNKSKRIGTDNLRFHKIIEDLVFTPHMKELDSIKTIAEKYGYNSRYLSSLFKKQMGMTFNDFLIKAKVDRCKNMLLDSKMEIKEIAGIVKYRSDYFVKFFKKHMGVTPSQYRKGLTGQVEEFTRDVKAIISK